MYLRCNEFHLRTTHNCIVVTIVYYLLCYSFTKKTTHLNQTNSAIYVNLLNQLIHMTLKQISKKKSFAYNLHIQNII